MGIFGFTYLIKNFILLKSIVVKGKKVKSNLYHHISFTLFMNCRIFKTPKLNTHKYNNYNIIEIYINILSLKMQIFIAIDYLILMLEKYLHFKKWRRHVSRNFFSPCRKNWIHVYLIDYVYLIDLYKNLKVIEISKLQRSLS